MKDRYFQLATKVLVVLLLSNISHNLCAYVAEMLQLLMYSPSYTVV